MEDLEVFLAVVEEGSQTAAAQRLGRSLQSVNRMLAKLERSVGVELVRRTTRHSTATEAGMAFYHRVRPAFSEIIDARLEAADRRAKPRGLLRLRSPAAFASAFVIPAIGRFLEQFPDVDIDLTVSDRPVDLIAEGIDLAIRIRRLPDSSLKSRHLGDIRIVAYASKTYFDRHGRPEHPQDLRRHRCLLREGLEEVWPFRIDGGAVSIAVEGDIKVNEVHAMNAAVAHGLGIHQGPYWHISEQVARGEFEIVLEDFEPAPMPVHAAYPPSRLTPAKTSLFVDVLAQQLRDKGVSL